MKKCPKCGHERRSIDDELVSPDECPRCGVFYEKIARGEDKASFRSAGPFPNQREETASNLEYVGFWMRAWATFLDGLIFLVCEVILLLLIYHRVFILNPRIDPAGDFLISYVFPAVVTTSFWVKKLATPGKMAISARIVDARTGGPPSLGQFIGRYFAYILSGMVLGLGFIWAAFDDRKQGWHDKLAGTVVVRKKTPVGVVFR